MSDSDPIINWKNIIWVNRSTPLYIIQYVVALISLSETCLLTYVGYKVSFVGGNTTLNSEFRELSSDKVCRLYTVIQNLLKSGR